MALQNGPSSGPVLTAHAFNCDVVTSARLGGKGSVSKGLRTGIGGYMCYCNTSKDRYWWGYTYVIVMPLRTDSGGDMCWVYLYVSGFMNRIFHPNIDEV